MDSVADKDCAFEGNGAGFVCGGTQVCKECCEMLAAPRLSRQAKSRGMLKLLIKIVIMVGKFLGMLLFFSVAIWFVPFPTHAKHNKGHEMDGSVDG